MKNLKKFMLVVVASTALLYCKKEPTNTNEATPVETTTDTLNTEITAENLNTESFKIEGMTCQMGCANAIESKLSALEGVKEAKVDFENKTATVSFDKTKQNKISLVKTIEAVAGGDTYKATEVEKKETI
jgi:periplasmic mercuric ion binding protein